MEINSANGVLYACSQKSASEQLMCVHPDYEWQRNVGVRSPETHCLGLISVYYTTQASSSVDCRSQNISSKYQHCGIHPVRCGPPYSVSFSRHSGRLLVNVSWQKEDTKAIKKYFVRYKALGSLSWSKSPVKSQNGENCTVENLNSSLVYTTQIQCVTNEKCSQCAWSEAFTVPSELTTQPVIVNLTDIAKKDGHRQLFLTWKFPAKELYDGYYVTIGKASGEAWEWMNTTQPEIRLILSYSAYHLTVSAVNNASISPAVSQLIPQREDMPKPLEPYKRYNITLHTRPNKATCNMRHVNNSESTYGSTQFYFIEGSPVSAPTNISSYTVTLNSVLLQWSSIPEEDIRGFLLGYIIYYTEYNPGGTSTERNISVDPTLNSYELGDLKGGTAYKVQISGFTQAGAGVRNTESIFKTKSGGFSNFSGVTVFAVGATVLIFGSVIIKRAKVILWPSIPNPGKSNALQKIIGPCELELLESINALKAEEWDTYSLQIVEKEDVIPASTLPLYHVLEDEDDSPDRSCNWMQRDTVDGSGGIPPGVTAETFPDIQRTDPQSSPFAFSSEYTTMELFQQGIPQGMSANTSVTQATESKPEDPDLTVVTSKLSV
ncbi:hypothetical protein FQN60_008126 [Etheostoma spectabile]|uniref:Fibronectin type-III domain-containing protein n=1 Tax=Etheostoma spectabile TaxID=54343 RepID=A0A5J5CYD6_9PERO|nr:hypothetical protein FQN60_008126 [Etheostoma spectabile]